MRRTERAAYRTKFYSNLSSPTRFDEEPKIIVLDYGSQYNQLITRRIREFGVFSELMSHRITAEEVKAMNLKESSFLADQTVFMMRRLWY